MRKRLKNEDLTFEERQKILDGVMKGRKYLQEIGIVHHDEKPENIVLKNGEAKYIDFGIVQEGTGRMSYREMGYTRRGSKYRWSSYLCKFF